MTDRAEVSHDAKEILDLKRRVDSLERRQDKMFREAVSRSAKRAQKWAVDNGMRNEEAEELSSTIKAITP